MENYILQRQRVARQRTERGIRVDQREVGGYVGSCCVPVGSGAQMQQLPAMLGPAVHRGKGMTYNFGNNV